MSRKLQVIFTDDAWQVIERITQEANENFNVGSISYSDVMNEMALSAKVDIKNLQLKNTNIRRSLKVLAKNNEIDLDSAIKALTELKSKVAKLKSATAKLDEVTHA